MSSGFILPDLKTSLKDLTEEELRGLIVGLRSNRRTVKQAAIKMSEKGQKDGTNTKTAVKQIVNGLSPAQVQQLLLQLNQGG